MTSRYFSTLLVILSLLGAPIFPTASPAKVRDQKDYGGTPPRISFIDGEISFWRPGAEDWSDARMNTAMAAGDSIYAGDAANVELQIGPRAFIRAGQNTELGLTTLEEDFLQIRVAGGHAVFDLKRMPSDLTIEVNAPNAAFTIKRSGYYRIDVEDDRTTLTTRRGGVATVVSAEGETTEIVENQRIILAGESTIHITIDVVVDLDDWDRWNEQRTAYYAETPKSAAYVPQEIAGVDDLDHYGEWRSQSRYGNVWVPRDVRSDWAPYTTGRWVYDPYYEWTWVDDAPWGWAPYHYGRWVHVDGYWGWTPGAIVRRPIYSPALVAFFGAPGIGVSLNVPLPRVHIDLPFVSWVALGFGEPVIPWWGRSGFVGRPSWSGWGGPRVVNNVVINNTKVVNVTNINVFQNASVANAVIGIDREHFGRGRNEHIRLDRDTVRRTQLVRGDLRVRPVAANLVVGETARGRRPPDRLRDRQVVAIRPTTQDPIRRLRDKGFTGQAAIEKAAPRIVRPEREMARGTRDRIRSEARGADPAVVAPERGDRAVRSDRVRPDPVERRGQTAPGEGARIAPAPPGREDRVGRERPAQAERRRQQEAATEPAAVAPPLSDSEGRGTRDRVAPPPPAARDRVERKRPAQEERQQRDSVGSSRVAPPVPERSERIRSERPAQIDRRQERQSSQSTERVAPPAREQRERPARVERREAPRSSSVPSRIAPPPAQQRERVARERPALVERQQQRPSERTNRQPAQPRERVQQERPARVERKSQRESSAGPAREQPRVLREDGPALRVGNPAPATEPGTNAVASTSGGAEASTRGKPAAAIRNEQKGADRKQAGER